MLCYNHINYNKKGWRVDFCCEVHHALCVVQGAQLPAETVAGLPGGAGDPAGLGERGASSANHQPGHQLLLWTVSFIPTSPTFWQTAVQSASHPGLKTLPLPPCVPGWCLETATASPWWTTSRRPCSSTWARRSSTARPTPTRGSLAPHAKPDSPPEVSCTATSLPAASHSLKRFCHMTCVYWAPLEWTCVPIAF